MRVVTLGEIMLRLKAPNWERLFQSPVLEATFGGGEANVAVSLAQFGLDVRFVSALPDNPIGDACIRDLRSWGIDTSQVLRRGGRMGIYFIEAGANQRPSKVQYDRSHSTMCETDPSEYNWDSIFSEVDWLHVTGITPALSESCARLSLDAVSEAKSRKITVSCDYNFRKKLWKYGKTAPEVMGHLVRKVDVGIANEEDCQKSLGDQG